MIHTKALDAFFFAMRVNPSWNGRDLLRERLKQGKARFYWA